MAFRQPPGGNPPGPAKPPSREPQRQQPQRPREGRTYTPPSVWKRKGGLEPPMEMRLSNENRRLVVAPPIWYDLLVLTCIIGGGIMGLLGLTHSGLFDPSLHDVLLYAGVAVAFSGLWAGASNDRMTCNIKQKTYSRLEGHFIRKIATGRLEELQALVLTSSHYLYPTDQGRAVQYRLTLYWKGHKEPILIIAQHLAPWPPNMPINGNAGFLFQEGQKVAHLLGIQFIDYSQANSPGPLPVL